MAEGILSVATVDSGGNRKAAIFRPALAHKFDACRNGLRPITMNPS
jgi:hypothetical protein